MIKLYDHPLSGNSYKVRLLLNQLGIDYKKIVVDIFKGEHKTEEFRELNPNQKIPVLVDGEFVIWESNAILLYLANKFSPNNYISSDPETFGLTCQWLLFGKTSIDPNLAVARYYLRFLNPEQYDSQELEKLQNQGNKALRILDDHFSDNDFLAGDYSIADIACYPYVMLSHEGGYDLSKYQEVMRWCGKVEVRPQFVPFSN